MMKCECYEEIRNTHFLTEFEQGQLYERTGKIQNSTTEILPVCNGTKERDACSCGGDKRFCTFYADVRNKAQEEYQVQADAIEIEFYRDYILENDLLYDVLEKYKKWKEKHSK